MWIWINKTLLGYKYVAIFPTKDLTKSTTLLIFSHYPKLHKCYLSEQPLLPPQTSRICNVVWYWTDCRKIQILHHTSCTIILKERQTRPIRIPRYCEVREIFLHDHRQSIILHQSTRPIEVRVPDIISMKTWRNTEDVVECLVPVRSGEHVGAAREEGFRDEKVTADCLGSVPIGTVEYWRIERFGDVLDGCIGNCGEVDTQICFKCGFVLSEWIHEFNAFIDVVAGHYLQGFIKPALEQQFAWKGGSEFSIDDRVFISISTPSKGYQRVLTKRECSIRSRFADDLVVDELKCFCRQRTCCLERANTCLGQERLKHCFLTSRARHHLEPRALHNGLLEWHLAFQTTISRDLVHSATTTSRFTNDGNLIRISAEFVDVLLDPLEG
jgi:hypothetical protein